MFEYFFQTEFFFCCGFRTFCLLSRIQTARHVLVPPGNAEENSAAKAKLLRNSIVHNTSSPQTKPYPHPTVAQRNCTLQPVLSRRKTPHQLAVLGMTVRTRSKNLRTRSLQQSSLLLNLGSNIQQRW